MKEDLYIKKAQIKIFKNTDNIMFDEIYNGPLEEPILVSYYFNIEKFKSYQRMLKEKRNR